MPTEPLAEKPDFSSIPPLLDVVIEVPRGSFLKRDVFGRVDFVSPLPCPFNYGSVSTHIGLEGDLLDAVVLGPRLELGERVKVHAWGAVGLTDRGLYDDKLICGSGPLRPWKKYAVLAFFHLYAYCKWVLNFYRGRIGRNACEGWGEASSALGRAVPRSALSWKGSTTWF